MITIWMAVSLGGGTAFFMCCSKCFHVCKVSTVPVYKKKKRLIISGKVIRSVLPLQYCSTSLKVLEYFRGSTGLYEQYWFYERMMH